MALVLELPTGADPGALGEVWKFVRKNDRCPARDFLREIEKPMRRRFQGSFAAFVRLGAEYQSQERFKPLTGAGKPLWEFKEADHRLYCFRRQIDRARAQVILLNGWVKDKAGKGKEEIRRIESALSLYEEYLEDAKGG